MYWYEKGDQKDVEKRHREKGVSKVSHIRMYNKTPSLELDGKAPEIEIVE